MTITLSPWRRWSTSKAPTHWSWAAKRPSGVPTTTIEGSPGPRRTCAASCAAEPASLPSAPCRKSRIDTTTKFSPLAAFCSVCIVA